jgi:hypothetical protein
VSYCRNNGQDSDVYVIEHVGNAKTGPFLYCYCGDGAGSQYFTRSGMIDHLLEHRRRGDKVPDRALDRLASELLAEGDRVS